MITEGCCERYFDNMPCDCKCANPLPGDSCSHTLCKKCRGKPFLNKTFNVNTNDPTIPYLLKLDDIKKYCLQYDKENGLYVESRYQGLALYEFINNQINLTKESFEDDGSYRNFREAIIANWEEEMEGLR